MGQVQKRWGCCVVSKETCVSGTVAMVATIVITEILSHKLELHRSLTCSLRESIAVQWLGCMSLLSQSRGRLCVEPALPVFFWKMHKHPQLLRRSKQLQGWLRRGKLP